MPTLYLAHHGILGQKWGVRRYQNPDGTLTPAGRRHYQRLDNKWVKKNADSIKRDAYEKSKYEINSYMENKLSDMPMYNSSGKVSTAYINAVNKKMAEVMNQNVTNLQSPSGQVIRFVAKRGSYGVETALASPNYDMSQLKNGVWGNGRVAYRKQVVDRQ